MEGKRINVEWKEWKCWYWSTPHGKEILEALVPYNVIKKGIFKRSRCRH
jgi:hypothetical protein